MAPKAKKTKTEWTKCSYCGIFFSSRDTNVHLEICNEKDCFQTTTLDQKIPHGYITGDILVGIIASFEGMIENIPKRLQKNMVLINPLTMKLMDFSIGYPVVINHNLTFIAWPDPVLGLTSIGACESVRNKIGVPAGQNVTAYSFSDVLINAKEIHFDTGNNEDFICTSQFYGFLSNYFDQLFITNGNTFELSYCGKPCSLKVCKVVTEIVNASDVTNELRNLKLSESATSEDCSKCNDIVRRNVKFFKVTKNTKIIVSKSGSQSDILAKTNKLLDAFGGYQEQLSRIQNMMNCIFVRNRASVDLSIKFPKGLLLYGPSGCGKSMLAMGLVESYSVHLISINGADIWSKFHGESEQNLVRLFNEAKEKSPSILFIDDIDSVCTRRDQSNSDVEKRVVSTMLTLIDDMMAGSNAVFVLAATSKRDNVDPALRRPGRLDREIEIPVPSAACRFQILKKIMATESSSGCDVSDEDIRHVADSAHGYVGADLSALYKEACMHALRTRSGERCTVRVQTVDLHHALSVVQPSAMREVAMEVPNVRWDDIGGQQELKYKLKQAIEWPIKHPEAFQRLGITPPKGLLMYGPPGCSKTMIAKALAKESGLNFIAIKGPELFSKWVGESERAVRELFRKARAAAPAIVFFDEIDALAGERGHGGGGGGDVSDRVLAQLLTEIDGVEALHDVTVVAATNRPDRIDKALLRPGRLDRIVYVPLPDEQTRREIFRIQFLRMPIAADVDINGLVQRSDRYSGVEVTAVCKEAALNAMQENIDIERIYQRHFDQAFITVRPRITDDMLDFYTNYAKSSTLHSI